MSLVVNVIADPSEQEAILPRLPPADDFHQRGSRLPCLARASTAACLVTVSDGPTIVASALLERRDERWFLWKGPGGVEASPTLLTALLDAILVQSVSGLRTLLSSQIERLRASWTSSKVFTT